MTAAELVQLRKRLSWSQAEAARQLGCSPRSIINWEKGTNKIPLSIAFAATAVVMNLPPYGKPGPLILNPAAGAQSAKASKKKAKKSSTS